METQKVALVTGANRGIGLEICRQLASKGMDVFLACRDVSAGEKARAQLGAMAEKIAVIACDVTSQQSVEACVQQVIKRFGRIDVLVNNAGVLLDRKKEEKTFFDAKVGTAEETLQTNTFGPLRMMQAVLPHMKKNNFGRIVNISSGMGQLSEMGGGYTAYRLSKTALNALTRIAADEVTSEPILVNSMCPGWVKTDMGGEGAERSVEQGAETATWLATLPDSGPRGGFFRDCKPIAW